MTEIKREEKEELVVRTGKPGRPRKLKKGRPTYKPFARLDVNNQDENFKYRWVDAEEVNRRMDEGWSFCNRTTGIPGDHLYPEEVGEEHPLDSARRMRELVLMATPKEDSEAYQEWVGKETDKTEQSLKQHLEQEANKIHPDMKAEGRIIIE